MALRSASDETQIDRPVSSNALSQSGAGEQTRVGRQQERREHESCSNGLFKLHPQDIAFFKHRTPALVGFCNFEQDGFAADSSARKFESLSDRTRKPFEKSNVSHLCHLIR
jgi:hypothetical protein